MSAPAFSPSKVTVNMDPVAFDGVTEPAGVSAAVAAAEAELMDSDLLEDDDHGPTSGEREVCIEWLVRTEDGQVGPVATDLIVRGVNLGKVPDTAEVSRPGSEKWLPISVILPPDEDAKDEAPSESIAMAPVVPIGAPEFEWPDSFSPESNATSVSIAPPSLEGARVSVVPTSAPLANAPLMTPSLGSTLASNPGAPTTALAPPTPPPMRSAPNSMAAPSPSAANSAAWMGQPAPSAVSSAGYDDPIAIPKTASPAVLAFGITIGISAFVAVGYAVIQFIF